jgi:hypothetical protein
MCKILLGIVLFICGTCLSGAAPASEGSIKQLLDVTGARKVIDGILPQIDSMMRQSMLQANGGKAFTAEEQKAVDGMQTKMIDIMKDELSWDKMEPLYISVYQQSLTQEEIDGMLEFYKTPAGTAVIKKMPLIIQNTMVMMQQRMGPMLKKVQAAVQETAQQIEKDKAAKDEPAAPAQHP